MSSENPFYRRIPQHITLEADLNPLAHHLFVVIAQLMNIRTNRLQITEQELAKAANMSPSSVRRYLVPLVEKGFIEVERAPQGTRIPATYRLAGDAARCILMEPSEGQRKIKQVKSQSSRPSTQSPLPITIAGVSDETMQEWIAEYGEARIGEVVAMLLQQEYVYNPGGWIRKALEEQWVFYRPPHP